MAAVQVLLPKLGFSMNEGAVQEWLAADGDQVTEGQTLYLLESEKSVLEIESPAAGILKIIASAGTVYEIGTLLAEIG
jgi:pyruvate/2-oxoglutarate dehydrogenase complex dihydrolipoamide acyltransferase (E2) component